MITARRQAGESQLLSHRYRFDGDAEVELSSPYADNETLRRLSRAAFELVVVNNQSVVSRAYPISRPMESA